MTIEELDARMNAQVQEDIPGFPEVVTFVDPARAGNVARMVGMDFTRLENNSPLGNYPALDLRGKIAIAVATNANGPIVLSDHVWLHEAVGHGSEEWLCRRGFPMYPSEWLDDLSKAVIYDPSTVQEQFWKAHGAGPGNYVDHIRQSNRLADSREWWAESMATLYDRTRTPFMTVNNPLFGSSVTPGLYVWRHWQ